MWEMSGSTYSFQIINMFRTISMISISLCFNHVDISYASQWLKRDTNNDKPSSGIWQSIRRHRWYIDYHYEPFLTRL